MFEKPFFQKLNKIADWIIRIVVINVIVLILCLSIVFFFVGIKVGYALFTQYLDNKETPIFRGAWETLKENFLKNTGFSVLFVAVLLFTGWNVYSYLNAIIQERNFLIIAGFFVTFSFLIGFFIISLYSMAVQYINPSLGLKETLKLALYLAGKYFLRSFVILLGFVLMPLLIFTVYTGVIYVLAGMSLSIIIFALLTRHVIKPYEMKEENNV